MKDHTSIEPLELRIAPASIITFTDVDGDLVKVKSSKGDLTGRLELVDKGGGRSQLVEIDLASPIFQGTNLTVSVKKVKGGPGDGLVNVGYINAIGVDLNKVVVPGDLGRIDAGDGNSTKPAIKFLSARSLGAFGVTTQTTTPGGGGDGPDLPAVQTLIDTLLGTVASTTDGLLGTLQEQLDGLLGTDGLPSELQRTLTSVIGVLQTLVDLDDLTLPDAIGPVTALLSNLATDLDELLDLSVLHPGAIPVGIASLLQTVKTSIQSALSELTDGLGGAPGDALSGILGRLDEVLGLLGGTIDAGIPANLLTALQNAIDDVAGSPSGGLGGLLGGVLGNTGILNQLVSDIADALDDLLGGPIGSVDLEVLVGNLTDLSVEIDAALLTNLDATAANLLNAVRSALNDILALPQVLLTDLQGALGGVAGLLVAGLPGALPDGVSGLVTSIQGLLDGIGDNLAEILANGGTLASSTLRDLALLQTQLLSLLGATAGQLTTEVMTTITTLIDIIVTLLGSGGDGGGGGGGGGGTVVSQLQSHILGDVGAVKIAKDVSNVFLNIVGNLKSLTVRGSLLGGAAANGGEIFTTANIQLVKIGKSILGGLNLNTGLIQSSGMMKTVKLGGSILGGVGNSSGQLLMTGDAKTISIRGDIIGNAGLFAASIDSTNGRIGSLMIKGSVVSGQNTDSGSIRVAGDLGKLNIKGNLMGDDDNAVVISAAAVKAPTAKSNFAFKSVQIGGRVAFANVLAGYDTDLDAVNAHAQIGAVRVGGDWVGSNLIAGATGGSEEIANFGTNADAIITDSIAGSVLSKIASIQIRGSVSGTAGEGGDHFGFVAQEIGKFRAGKNKVTLATGSGNDAVKLAQATGADVGIHELGATFV